MASSGRLHSLLAVVVIVLVCAFTECASGLEIVAAGASFPERLYDALSFAFSSELPQYSLSYTSLGSTRGKCRILNYTAVCPNQDGIAPTVLDWAGTDSIHSPSDYINYPDLQMYPAVAGAVVAVYNLQDVEDLILTVPVLADIFRKCVPGVDPACTEDDGYIQYWNDSRIRAANPHIPLATLTAAGEIKVVVRADGSGTTEIFKQALAKNSANFSARIGQVFLGESPNWNTVSVRRGNTNRGVASVVLNTPSSLGYVSLDEARSAGLKYAGVGRSVLATDGVLRANAKSIEYALLERGFAFGNNGDNKTHLTASVMGATGTEAWPIVGYTYFSTRKNTKRSTSCELRRAVYHWFQWFYSSETVVDISVNQGFVVLPKEGREFILKQLQNDFRCDSQLVFSSPAEFPVADDAEERLIHVQVDVQPELGQVLALYADAYRSGTSGFALVDVSPVIAINLGSGPAIRVADVDTIRTQSANSIILPFAGVPWGITYNFCPVSTTAACTFKDFYLVLTPQLTADLLSGRILYWNDSALVAVQETPAQAALLANSSLPVIVINYQQGVRERVVFEHLNALRGFDLDLNQQVSSDYYARGVEEATRIVAATVGSITFGPINPTTDATVSRIARMSTGTAIISSAASSIKACIKASSAPAGTRETNVEIIARYAEAAVSPSAQCWPFVTTYFLAIPQSFTTTECLTRSAQEAAFFLVFLLRTYVDTVQDPLSQLGMARLVEMDTSSTTYKVAELQCFGRSITNAQVDLQLVPAGLVWTVRAMAAVLLGLICALICWIYYNRSQAVVRASSPIFMYQMCLGFVLEVLAVFPLTMQDDPVSNIPQAHLDIACMAAPWLYVLGFSVVYGSLLAKTWRIYKIFHNPAMKRVHITAWFLFKLQILLGLPVLIIMIAWTLLDPFSWKRSTASLDPTTGEIVSTKGECASNQVIHFVVPIIGIFAAYICTGLVLAWKNRNTPTEFSEGRYVSGAIMTDTELLIIGVPVLVITSANPVAAFVVKVTFILLSVTATILVFFYPKFAILNGFWDSEPAGSTNVFKQPIKVKQNSSKDGIVGHGSAEPSPRNATNRGSASFFNNRGSITNTHRPASGSFQRTSSMENLKVSLTSFAKNAFTRSRAGTINAPDEQDSFRERNPMNDSLNTTPGSSFVGDLTVSSEDSLTAKNNHKSTGNDGYATMFFQRDMVVQSAADVNNNASMNGSSSKRG